MMVYEKKEYGSFNLHMIKTDKFKTAYIDLLFSNRIVKEEISKTNFLAGILCQSTNTYKTNIDFMKKCEDLYSLDVTSSCYRIGKNYNMDFNAAFQDKLKEIFPNDYKKRYEKYKEQQYIDVINDSRALIERLMGEA